MSLQHIERGNRFARIGFNGELHEAGAHWQMLGNGRRVYNPVLHRFHSPDPLSPFGRGGINAYAYCGCDPLNFRDPSGRFALPVMLLGLLAGAGGAGIAAAAGAGDREGGGNSPLPWIIGGAIAAVGLIASVGMAGRQQLMKLGNSSAGAPGGSWASRVGAASPSVRTAPSAPVSRAATPPRSRSPSPHSSVDAVRRDERGTVVKSMSELPSPVSRKITEIREFGPRGLAPDPGRVPKAKPFFNEDRLLPPARGSSFYHRYPVYQGRGHGYESWRIVTASSYSGGMHAVYVTPNHYGSFFKVTDWSRPR